MNLLIIGNIASGKTTLSEKIVEKLGGKHTSIDNLRREFSDGTFAGEFKAWGEMLDRIQHPDPHGEIFEFSGTGKNAWFTREAIKYSQEKHNAEWLVVYCLCDKAELVNRCEGRTYDVPIPYNFGSPVSSIAFMSEDLRKKHGTGYWNSQELTIRTDELTTNEAADGVIHHLT